MQRFRSSDDRKRQPDSKPQSQKLEMEAPKQANLQFVDDTWGRLLNAMERLEQVTEDFKLISASHHDKHADKDNVQEDELDVRSEVHLQIKALQRVIHPVKDEVGWLTEDFLTWFGGREPRKLVATDEYAVPILKCLHGVAYTLPKLPEAGPLTQNDMMRTIEALSVGLHASDKIVDNYVQNPDQQAARSRHLRGTVEQGMRRLQLIPDPWVRPFLRDYVASRQQQVHGTLASGPQAALGRAPSSGETRQANRGAVPGERVPNTGAAGQFVKGPPPAHPQQANRKAMPGGQVPQATWGAVPGEQVPNAGPANQPGEVPLPADPQQTSSEPSQPSYTEFKEGEENDQR